MCRQIYRASQNWSLEATRMTFLSGICGRFENFYFNLDIKLCSKGII